MKIAFDHTIFSIQRYGGISRYFIELASHLNRYGDVKAKIFAAIHLNKYLLKVSPNIIDGKYVKHIPNTLPIRKIINWPITKIQITKFKPDIIHETFYPFLPIKRNKSKLVITIHDMIHERFPDQFPFRDKTIFTKKQALKRADHIICVSNKTKTDLLNYYQIDPHKISVIYEAVSADFLSLKINTNIPKLKKPYLLFIGNRSKYKNFPNTITAYSKSIKLRKDFDIVCFGGGNFNKYELNLFKDLGLNCNDVIHISGGDDILANLYLNAIALLYPSAYEGFGCPLLEAMSFGCPVICSNNGSIPEIAQDAAEYFAPDNIEDIIHSIEKVTMSSQRQKELKLRGYKRVNFFSYERCAEETLKVYKSLLE